LERRQSKVAFAILTVGGGSFGTPKATTQMVTVSRMTDSSFGRRVLIRGDRWLLQDPTGFVADLTDTTK
jgi:hypothetical protein